jgi:multidrug transporter EmrE-like cation transporter
MLYLLLAIICSASIALIFKHSETSGMNRYAVTSANYLAACIVSGSIVLVQGLSIQGGEQSSIAGIADEIGRSLAAAGETLSPNASLAWAILVGLVAGAVFFLGFIYYQLSVRRHGVGLAGAFAKLGILVPMSLSLLLWREYPSAVQWVGIVLAVSSIVLVNWPSDGDVRGALRPALLLLFLFGGAAEFSNKVFQKYAQLDHRSIFLFVTFLVALLCSLAATIAKKGAIRRRDVLTGVAVGVPNLFSSFFLIMALSSIPAAVAFPAYGAGTIVIINVVGVVFFRERPTRVEQAAVALTVLALVLINL